VLILNSPDLSAILWLTGPVFSFPGGSSKVRLAMNDSRFHGIKANSAEVVAA
jgi:hypothetical protein